MHIAIYVSIIGENPLVFKVLSTKKKKLNLPKMVGITKKYCLFNYLYDKI